MADDPSNVLRALMERLSTEVESIGLHLETVAFIPSMREDGPMMMQAVFMVQPESIAAPTTEEGALSDEEEKMFADLAQGFSMDEAQDEQASIKESLRKLLDGE